MAPSLCALALLAASCPGRLLAQDAPETPTSSDPFRAWAEAIAASAEPRWSGPRAQWPSRGERPAVAQAARSLSRPLTVHVDPEVSRARADAALQVLERAHALLAEIGYGEPIADGGLGGSDGLDLYLRSGVLTHEAGSLDAAEPWAGEPEVVGESPLRVGWDARVAWSPLDAVTTFAEVEASLPDTELETCVAMAYAEALLAQQDPAEAPAWRHAHAAYLAWRVTGRFDCGEAVDAAQREPWRGVVSHTASGGAGAMLLAMIDARAPAGSERVRQIWEASRQYTWDGDELRADPDASRAYAFFLAALSEPLDALIPSLAVARWWTGARAAQSQSGLPFVSAVRVAPAQMPGATWTRLPRTIAHGAELEPWGSAYALVDVREAPAGARLRIWLRGEFGARWSLLAVRIGADGRERSRLATPIRDEPRGYLPLELMSGTERVLLVVTNIGNTARAPDADEPAEGTRGFKLVVDRGR